MTPFVPKELVAQRGKSYELYRLLSFFFFNVLGQIFPLTIYPWQLSVQKNKTMSLLDVLLQDCPGQGPGETEGQLGQVALLHSRATSEPPCCHPLSATDAQLDFPHCCAGRRGLSCLQGLVVQPPSPEPFGPHVWSALLSQADGFLPLLHGLQEKLGAPLDWV